MEGKTKATTEAERQIQRLANLRALEAKKAQENAEKAFDPKRTLVEKTIERLQNMKAQGEKNQREEKQAVQEAVPGKPALLQVQPGSLRVKGAWKSVKLTEMQITALDRLCAKEPSLHKSDVLRIALNRLLGLPASPLEAEWEQRISKVLDAMKKEQS